MSSRIRIGAVAYLNTAPLVYGMEQGLGAERIELSYDVPAVLERRMSAGELDLALLPVVALATLPGLEVVPGFGITVQRAARSVLLVCQRPLELVRTVALDAESRTSNLLVQLLFDRAWKRRPRYTTGSATLEETFAQADAAVRIGDKALFEPLAPGLEKIDLGRAWNELTGLPFVFAVWAARPGTVDDGLRRILHESRRAGIRALPRIAAEFHWRGRRDPELVRRYLTEHIDYGLGTAELEALRLFFFLSTELGLIPTTPELALAGLGAGARQVSVAGE